MSSSIARLIVYNAHNGEAIEIPKPIRFHSLQSFKAHILDEFSLRASIDNIFLLTPFGLKFHFQMADECTEVYFYDRRLFEKSIDEAEALRYIHSTEVLLSRDVAPESFELLNETNETSETRMSEILKSYDQWARALLQQTSRSHRSCDLLITRINSIFKSLNIIFQFFSNFVKASERSFGAHYASIKLLWTKSLRHTWSAWFSSLKSLPDISLKNSKPIVLSKLLEENTLNAAATFLDQYLPLVVDHFNSLSGIMNSINEGTLEIDKMIESLRVDSNSKFSDYEANKKLLMAEIDSFRTAFVEDSPLFLNKQSQRGLCSKHRELSKGVFEASLQVFNHLHRLEKFYKQLVLGSVPIFQAIALLQLKAVNLRNESKTLMQSSDQTNHSLPKSVIAHQKVEVTCELVEKVKKAEDTLSMTVDLPLLFGFTIIEKRRQFEWIDFFQKGLIHNLTEQLTIVIEHEKSFQTLWMKKFGHYIKNLNGTLDLMPQIPVVDVTLINGVQDSPLNNFISWTGALDLEREDILNYIGVLRENKYEKFVGILETNYKDMIQSTNHMNQMSKLVSSLSYVPSDSAMKSQALKKGSEKEIEQGNIDSNLVAGLKSRIRKLENLLHQNQFQDLSNWPVVRTELVASNAQMSLIVSNEKETRQNFLKFLQKSYSSPDYKTHSTVPKVPRVSKVLDASITIDKHLDNIRLRRESAELLTYNQELVVKSQTLMSTNQLLASENEKLSSENKRLLDSNSELKEATIEQESRIHRLEEELQKMKSSEKLLNSELLELKNKLSIEEKEKKEALLNIQKKDDEYRADRESLQVELASSKAENQELVKIKSELLTNMMDKEQDFASERSDLQREINDLNLGLDQKSQDFDNLLETVQNEEERTELLLHSLNDILQTLFDAIEELSKVIITYFREFCLVTQSMGLLLVKEPRQEDGQLEFRIRRVKGLRTKNPDDTETESTPSMKSVVIGDIDEAFSWLQTARKDLINSKVTTVPDSYDQSSSRGTKLQITETQSHALIDVISNFLDPKDDGLSLLDRAVKLISFTENVQLQSHDKKPPVDEGFFYNGIVKRFSDVEGYAKKLTKENKAKTIELSKLLKVQNDKITINNFHEGDLVLFLPTAQSSDSDDDERTPWTAFNINAPHYFLDLESQPKEATKEWIVNRISQIIPHEVTEENINDKDLNPYSLRIGDTWYSVLTKLTN